MILPYRQILTSEDIRQIAHSLGKAKKSGNGYMCCCPAHDDHNPSLSISLGMNGQLLLRCFAECEFEDILKAIQDRGLLAYNLTETKKISRKPNSKAVKSSVMPCKDDTYSLQQCTSEEPVGDNQEIAYKIWSEGSEINGTPAEPYFQKRGIDTASSSKNKVVIKYHPNCGDNPEQKYGGLVAQVTNESGHFLGIHRIFLTSAGDKMPMENPKKSLGPIKGGGVRLNSSQKKVILTEGVEDALILAQCCQEYQVIAFLGGNTSIKLPEFVQEVIIAADVDLAGQKQARRIKKRLQEEGKAVGICTPLEGKDFNEFFLKTLDYSLVCSLINNVPLEVSGRITKKTEAYLAFKYQTQELSFLVKNLIPLGGICLLAGHPKVGKSWMILNWVLGIINGKKVFGQFTTQKVGIFLCSLEDNRQRLKSRYLKMSNEQEPPEGFYITTMSLPLDKEGIEKLKKELEDSPEIKLLIIDPYEKVRPQQKSHHGTAYQSDYKDIGLLKELADEFEITILLVHHLKKGDTGNIVTDINGSMGLTGAVDTILALYKEEDTGKFRLKVTGKDVEEQEFILEFDVETGLYSLSQETQNTLHNLSSQILGFLSNTQKACSPKEIAEALGKNTDSEKTMVRQQLKSLLERKWIKQPRKGFYEIISDFKPYNKITDDLTGSTSINTRDYEDNCKVVIPNQHNEDQENIIEIVI